MACHTSIGTTAITIMTPKQKAEAGVRHLKDAILDHITEHPEGVRHAQIVKDLRLQSGYEGKQKNYLSWSIIGLLLADERVRYEGRGRGKTYYPC